MQKIVPFLWFDTQAEEAANFYVSLIPNSRILNVSRFGDEGAGPKGQVMTVEFELNGEPYLALNGGPMFKFTEAVSFMIPCDTQQEVDMLWDKLTADGGEPSQCGWLKDKYGLSWQITPRVLMEMIADSDEERKRRVMEAMLQMVKLDIPTLQRAYDGEPAPL